MLDLIALVYRFAGILRIVCAGYQVADAVTNLSRMVRELDELKNKVQKLADQIGDTEHGASSNITGRSSAGGD